MVTGHDARRARASPHGRGRGLRRRNAATLGRSGSPDGTGRRRGLVRADEAAILILNDAQSKWSQGVLADAACAADRAEPHADQGLLRCSRTCHGLASGARSRTQSFVKKLKRIDECQSKRSMEGSTPRVNEAGCKEMDHKLQTSNDLIDNLVRAYFAVEPEVMAKLAHGDEQVRLRRPPGVPGTTDPLDGVEVLVRRVIAAVLGMRKHYGAVSLLTERQAQGAGWPSARLVNMVLVLALALYIETDPSKAVPVLIETNENAPHRVSRLIRVDNRLPSLEKLQKAWRRGWLVDKAAMERTAQARESAPFFADSRLVSLNELLQDWLGVDAHTVELPGDRRRDGSVCSGGARAMYYFDCLAVESLNMGHVMQTECVKAVRFKTEDDARIARQPGAVAANFALLLGAAICHGSGYTVHLLPEREEFAADLIEAGRRFQGGLGLTGDDKAVALLDIEDLAARGYVHVGRREAGRAARRVMDMYTASDA